MKRIVRVILGLGLAAAMVSCTVLSNFHPSISVVTRTPSVTPTFTPSPVPTATPTPIPTIRIENADKALFDGDLDTALSNYRAAFDDTSDSNIKAAALWGMARAQSEGEHYSDALTYLQQLINDYPQSQFVASAYFLEGQDDSQSKLYDQAAAAYQSYLTARPGVIDSYVLEQQGDSFTAEGNYANALEAYTAAQAAPHLDDAQALLIKIAQTRAQIGDYATAISMYNTIAADTNNDYIKAQMDYLTGEAYLAIHQDDQAFGFFRDAVANYPLSNYSYLGLVELVDAKAEVSDLDRGLTDYFAGQYDVALAALDRYISANPGNDGTPHYYRALTLEALENYPAAVDEFTHFIQTYPNHRRWADAWNNKADIQWMEMGDYKGAAQTLLDYVKAAPGSTQAPDALIAAGQILERDGDLEQAAQVWERVANEYSGNDQAPTAEFDAGIMRYRAQDYNGALSTFQHDLVIATAPEDQARASLWIGKTQQMLNNPSEAQSAWQQAQTIDPTGYYSLRAHDLLLGQEPFTSSNKENLNIDLASERKDADSWVRLTFNLPADTDLSGPGPLASDPRLIRGTEFWNLGLYEEARAEFEDMRNTISTNAVATYRFGNYLLDLGAYRSAIFAIRQVLTLAGLNDTTTSMMAPAYFSHVRYGLYYSDLIVLAAQANGLDPLFLFSVVRQESLFEGFVSSTAGARGLMQIVPATGATIASSLGWPNDYDADQLYRPLVSIRLGAYYFASNRKLVGGSLYNALAAYNSGPGSALAWSKLSGDDPDLFLETIRFAEPQQYIRNIYEIYAIYTRLYGSGS